MMEPVSLQQVLLIISLRFVGLINGTGVASEVMQFSSWLQSL